MTINKTHAEQVMNLLKHMDMHVLLYGVKGVGKKTIIQSVFNSLFPDDKISECAIKHYEVDKNESIPIKMTSNYIEINCNLIRNQSRVNVLEFIKDMSKNYVFGPDGFIRKRFIILHDIDILSVNIQYSLRRILEQYTDTVVFVFTTSSFNKIIDAFKSRTVCLKIGLNREDIAETLKRTLNVTKRTTQAKLRNYDDMISVFLDMDGISPNANNYTLVCDFIRNKHDNVVDMKQSLHDILSTNVTPETIIKNILKTLKIPKTKIQQVYELASSVDVMCVNGSKVVITLEYFVFKLKIILKS